jgi:hypothetical protein
MSDLDQLLRDFIAEDRRTGGDADPASYLARASGDQRDELEALIDGYLARAPRRAFDTTAFEASPARATAEALWRSIDGASGRWPTVLPELRHRAQVTRAQLAARLARALGVGDREAKVAAYYHAMERGSLPSAGVSGRVLEALGAIVGESAERLRELGLAASGSGGISRGPHATFARTATPDPDLCDDAPPGALGPNPAEAGRRDEVDELFTGASGA